LLWLLMTSFIFWYMCSARNGTWGLINTFTFKRTSKSTFRLSCICASPIYPLRRDRFNRTYQFVKWSRNIISCGTTLYSLYSSISFRTLLMSSCSEHWIQRSVMLKFGNWTTIFSSYLKSRLVYVSHLVMFWMRNR